MRAHGAEKGSEVSKLLSDLLPAVVVAPVEVTAVPALFSPTTVKTYTVLGHICDTVLVMTCPGLSVWVAGTTRLGGFTWHTPLKYFRSAVADAVTVNLLYRPNVDGDGF